MASTLGQLNLLGYRGYVFDHETGLYYLQNRYYDPKTGRFLNADAFASTGQGLLSNNMFAYCYNNPVNSHDPNGMCSHSVYTGGSVGPEGCYRCKNNQNYIDNQDDETIAKKRLGIVNVGHAGCGPIAVYNAAVTMGMNVTFDEVLDYYNSHPLKMDAFGLAGTSVDLIVGFFEPKGYDVICAYNMDSIDALSPLADASILYYKFPRTYFIPKTSFGINAYGAHFAEYVTIQEVYTMCKRLFIWLLIIAVLVAFNACHSPVYLDFKANSDTNANNNIDAEINSNGDILLDDNGLLCFSSAEEFSQYLHSPKRDDDIAKTNELEKYYMLKNVPDGYELYKITAGSFDIGFWYLPSAALASAESIWAAEAAQEHFLFISPRAELKLSDTLLQHGMTKDDLLDGKYYFKKSTTPVIIWEYDGLVMLLYTPKNQKAINCEDIGQLCELNKICP